MDELAGLFEYDEPDDVRDVLVDGIARIEPLASGQMVRVWLYTERRLSEPVRAICARLVLPLGLAMDITEEAARAYRKIHRASNPLKAIG